MRTNKAGQKLYPYNAIANQLNLQKCCRHYEDKLRTYVLGEIALTDAEAQETERLIMFFDDVSFSGRIVYVTGKQLGFLRRACDWADADRAEKAAAAGGRG